ncbi:hypothetical protein ABI59_12410 [Acidobacteria bacterium Mor1]|nr:hypothetical protein ABI59_12410 [Acidobacteria bacterium Mor1]
MFEDGDPHIVDDEFLVYVWVPLPRDPASAGKSQSLLADLYRTPMRSGPSRRSNSVPVTVEVRAWNEGAIDAVLSLEDYGEFDARFELLEPHREIQR